MRSDPSDSKRVMRLLEKAERALTRAELTDAYREEYGVIDAEFRHQVEKMNRDGNTSIDMITAVRDYGLDVLPSPWSPTTRIYFSRKEQVSNWIDYIRQRPPDTIRASIEPDRIRKIIEACESGMSPYDAVHQTGVGRNTVHKYYNLWKSVPSEVLEDTLGGKGVTVAEARAVAAKRLDLPLSDGLVRSKLDLMVLLERCEKVKENDEVRYRTLESGGRKGVA